MGDILQQLADEQEQSNQRVREIIAERSPKALAEYDAGMESIRSGRYNLAMLWHSLTEPQRRVVKLLVEGSRTLHRCRWSNHFFDAYGEPHAVSKAAGLATVTALVRHGVLRWSGREGDAGARAELASRGYALLAFLKTQN